MYEQPFKTLARLSTSRLVRSGAGRLAALLVSTSLLFAGCDDRSAESYVASAREQLAQRSYDTAIIELKNALQKDARSPQARYLLGVALLAKGQLAEAVVELRKARDLGYDDAELLPKLVSAMVRLGRFQAVVDDFATVELAAPAASAELRSHVAMAWMALGRHKEAADAIASALVAQQDHPRALVLRARLLAASQDLDGAERVLRDVLAVHPGDAPAWKALGDLLQLGHADASGALDAYRKAINLDLQDLESHARAVDILLGRDDLPAARNQLAGLKAVAAAHPHTRFLEARVAFREQNFEHARNLLQDALRVLSDQPDVLELAGATELQIGSPLQAQAHLAKALQLAPQRRATRRLLAEAYLRGGQVTEALATLQPALGDLADAQSVALAARVHMQNGDRPKAEALWRRAVGLNPNDTQSRVALLLSSISRGQVDASLNGLRELAARDPGTTADMALITTYLARSRFDDAKRAIDDLERKSDNKAAVAHLRGRAQLLMGQPTAARASFERALTIDGTYFPSTASLATLDWAERKPEEARRRLEAVLAGDPQHVQALLMLAELKGRTNGTSAEVASLLEAAVKAAPGDPEPRVKLVEHHLRTDRPSAALEAAQQAVAAVPEMPQLLDVLGRAQLATGEAGQALRTFGRLTGLRRDHAPYQLRLAEAQLAVNDSAAARVSLQRALQLDPDLLEAQRMLVTLALREGKPEEALAVARQVQKQRPRNAVGYEMEGDVATQRRPAEAMVLYRKALALTPTTSLAIKLHLAMTSGGKLEDARQFAEGWRRDQPRDALFAFHLANLAIARGDLSVAEVLLRDVLAVTPQNYLALNNLAWVLLRQDKPGASEFAKKAMQLKPNDAAVMDTLALSLAADRQFDQAIEVARRAIELQPQAHVFKLNLARIYVNANRKAQAESLLSQLEALGDAFAGQAEVRRLRDETKGG